MRKKAAELRGSGKKKRKLHQILEDQFDVNEPRGSKVFGSGEPNMEGSESHK